MEPRLDVRCWYDFARLRRTATEIAADDRSRTMRGPAPGDLHTGLSARLCNSRYRSPVRDHAL